MKIKENITIYQCEYCSKVYQRKSYCIEHENVCKKNPDNIPACWGCKHLTKREFEEKSHNGWMGYTWKGKSLYCNKKEIFMKPLTSTKKCSEINYNCETVSEATPRECEDFETLTIKSLEIKKC